jgi:7,8-dihydroneopterin aldolase/epimerase/oxygenase
MPEGDSVHIEQLEIFSRVGVTDNERSNPQRLTLTITAWPKDGFDNIGDDITRAVNYSAFGATSRDFATEHSFHLIETFAVELAQLLLQKFPIRKIRIELRKFVLPNAQHVSVSVTRTAPN